MTRMREFLSRWAVIATATAVVAAPIVVGGAAAPPDEGSDFCREDKASAQLTTPAEGEAIRFQVVAHTTGQVMTDPSTSVLACASPGCRWFPRGGGCNVVPEDEEE